MKEKNVKRQDVAAVLAAPYSRELLESPIPARFAYVGVDDEPRVVPMGFWWSGEQLILATVPGAAKVRALRRRPRVAITIDTQDRWPPLALLIRGTARVELVEGVPDAYLEAARKGGVPAERFDEWEQGVRALYDRMALITVEPDWAKLLDFETTLPKAVEDLMSAREAEGSGARRES